MPLFKSVLAGAVFLAAATAAAGAQPYPYGQPYPVNPAQAAPQSWSYDPYTSGMAPCPQGIHGDLETCAQKMPPTAGQPSYWPAR
jgi:hypothetical protein